MKRKGGYHNPWTQKELKVLWENRELSIKELHQLIPEKTEKAVKNFKGYFSRLSEEKIKYIESHFENSAASDIDRALGLAAGTTRNYLRMNGKEALFRTGSTKRKEIETIKELIGEKSFPEIAKILGVSHQRVRNIASKHGLHASRMFDEEEKRFILASYADGKTKKWIAEKIYSTQEMIDALLMREGVQVKKTASPHTISQHEDYIIKRIEKVFDIELPDKTNPKNRDYYWNIIPPYEVDIPFEINGLKFAIEYDSEWWHKDVKEKDAEKTRMLEEKGYYVFRISSAHHTIYRLESLDPILNMLVQAIQQIVKAKERSTTIESITG